MRMGLAHTMALLLGLFFVGDVHAEAKSFVHPEMLSTEEDFSRAKRLVAANVSPAADSWRLLEKSGYAAATYTPNAVPKVVRGNPSWAKEAMTYVVQGSGNGAFPNAMWKAYPGTFGAVGLAQVQESGRDQGHSTLDIALIGVICQMAWNQHDDLFAFNDNLAAKASEYVAQYNLWNNVPWTHYTTADGSVQAEISPASRGSTRPIWTLIYNHYVGIRGLSLPYTKGMMDKFGPEAGAYGANSGGFDQLGYGSLLFANYLETAVRKQ